MQFNTYLSLFVALLGLQGCSQGIIVKETPPVSHIHIGHAITGFAATPRNQGLLVMAEISSVVAATNNELLRESAKKGNVSDSKLFIEEIAVAVNPAFFDSDSTPDSYGLQRSVAEAITHLELAAGVPDASQNVQRTVTRANIKARQIVRNVDELSAFLDAGLKANNSAEIQVIAEEINSLVDAIAGGEESNANYGLFEFRRDIEDMVASEDPPYQTVDSFFLFNLIQLPSGDWGFSSRQRRRGTSYGS